MKKLCLFLVGTFVLFQAGVASALIIDLAGDDTSPGYFKDTRTGFIWWDLDVTYFASYDAEASGYEGIGQDGFHLATKHEVQKLEYSINHLPYPVDPMIYFTSEEGFSESGSDVGHHGDIHGFYDDGNPDDGISWVKGSIYGGEWYYGSAWFELSDPSSLTPEELFLELYRQRNESFLGVGSMIVDTSHAVPEPATILLFATGSLGMWLKRKRKYCR